MIRSRSTMTIPPNSTDNLANVEKSNNQSLLMPPSSPKLARSSSYSSPRKLKDKSVRDFGDETPPKLLSKMIDDSLSKEKQSSGFIFRSWKCFIFLVVIGAAIYFFIAVYFGAYFIQDTDIVLISKPQFEARDQVTVLINTFKRPDIIHGMLSNLTI